MHLLNGSVTPRAFLVFVFQPQHPDRKPIPLMEVSDEGLSRDLLYIEMNSLYRDELTAHKQHTPIYILKTQVVPHQVLIHALMIKFYLAFSVNKGKGKEKCPFQNLFELFTKRKLSFYKTVSNPS